MKTRTALLLLVFVLVVAACKPDIPTPTPAPVSAQPTATATVPPAPSATPKPAPRTVTVTEVGKTLRIADSHDAYYITLKGGNERPDLVRYNLTAQMNHGRPVESYDRNTGLGVCDLLATKQTEFCFFRGEDFRIEVYADKMVVTYTDGYSVSYEAPQ